MAEQFLVTGALGCLGAWVVRNLVREGVGATVLDVGGSMHRLRLIMTDDEIGRVQFITGDITDLAVVENAVRQSNATHIIHLAALQVPFCKADPTKGAMVNVVGTVNIFEAAKRARLQRVVYASSVAVYGPEADYPEGIVDHDAALGPRNLYGVYKQANEGTARIYWWDYQVSSIGLRPYTIYGPGRDQGMTSGPTKAMLAAAAGQPYHIPFGGRGAYQYADDVARIFIEAARAPFQGAEVFNIRGSIADVKDVIGAIEAAVPQVRGKITADEKPLSLPTGVEDTALTQVIKTIPDTPLDEGVAATISIFGQALSDGRIRFEE